MDRIYKLVWDGMEWFGMGRSGLRWDGVVCDGMEWFEMGWSGLRWDGVV